MCRLVTLSREQPSLSWSGLSVSGFARAPLHSPLILLADLQLPAACEWKRSVSIDGALQVAKAFGDMEAIFTYEGTYEVNALVAGRGITGKAAFKAAPSRQPRYVQA